MVEQRQRARACMEYVAYIARTPFDIHYMFMLALNTIDNDNLRIISGEIKIIDAHCKTAAPALSCDGGGGGGTVETTRATANRTCKLFIRQFSHSFSFATESNVNIYNLLLLRSLHD